MENMSRKKKQKQKGTMNNTNELGMSPFKRLLDSSPVARASIKQNAAAFMQSLFPENRAICAGIGYWNCEIKKRNEFREPWKLGAIVPAYMKRMSLSRPVARQVAQRSSALTGRLRFLVFSPMSGSWNDHAVAIRKLTALAPLVTIVRADPYFNEAWFTVGRMNDEEIEDFRRRTVELGGSGDIWIDCHTYALPGGWNVKERMKQEVLYWSPKSIL